MSAPMVFLSAVTKDFGLPYLEELRRKIQHPGIACRFRGNLEQSGKLLPEKLEDEIKAASCVIHLVGPSFGFGPEDVMVPDLERTPAGEYWKDACKSWWPLDKFPTRRSYTQMELDFAFQLGRPVYVIFVDDPALVSAASQPESEAQLQKAHRTAIERRGHEYGKVESIASLGDLIGKLPLILDHLRGKIAALEQKMTNAADRLEAILPPPPKFDLHKYADALIRHCLRIPLTDEFGSSGMERLTLREVFVAPYVRFYPLREPKDIELPADIRDAALRGETAHLPPAERVKAERYQQLHREQSRKPAIDIINATDWRGHIILGDAGLGKTSLVRHLALTWADEWVKKQGQDVIERMPLYIELKSYAAATGQRIEFTLLGYLQRSPHSIFNLPELECLRELTEGRALLILDALDEVADPAIQQAIARQAHELALKGASIVVTSRASGFDKSYWPDAETWNCWLLEGFEEKEREEFLAKAAPLLWTSETDRTQRLADLRRRIEAFPAIERLTRNPLLLTLIVLMHRSNRLGESRVAIYDEASKWLLDRWEELNKTRHTSSVPAVIRRRIVRHLARRIYDSNLAARLGENLFPLSLLQEVIREVLDPKGTDPEGIERHAEELPSLLRERHSVLCWVGGEHYAFVHRSFLEFFVAEAWTEELDLASLSSKQVRKRLLEARDHGRLPHWLDDRYQNIIPLYFGLLKPERARERLPCLWKLRRSFLDSMIPGFHREMPLFAAACFAEVQDRSLHPEFEGRLWEMLTHFTGSPRPPKDRILRTEGAYDKLQLLVLKHIMQIWGDTAKCLDWLLGILADPECRQGVRIAVMSQPELTNARRDQLESALHHIIEDRKDDPTLRAKAMKAIVEVSSNVSAIFGLLGKLLKDCSEADAVRIMAASLFAGGWEGIREFRNVEIPAEMLKDETMSKVVEILFEGKQPVTLGQMLRNLLMMLVFEEQESIPLRYSVMHILRIEEVSEESLRNLHQKAVLRKDVDRSDRIGSLDTLLRKWGKDGCRREILEPIIRNEKDDLTVRYAAIDNLQQAWGREDWAKGLLMEIAQRQNDDDNLRRDAIKALAKLWGREEWLRKMLVELAGQREEDERVRRQAIQTLVEIWQQDTEVRALLEGLAGQRKEDGFVRRKAIRTLGKVWQQDATLRALLEGLAGQREKDKWVRNDAKDILESLCPEEPPKVGGTMDVGRASG